MALPAGHPPGSGASTVGAPKGVQPVTGSVPAEAPQGYRPHSYEPQAFDPGLCAVCSTPEGTSSTRCRKARAAHGLHRPEPGRRRDVYLLMSKNFPPDAIGWVKARTTSWVGPVWVPWPRVDQDDRDKWAASHQRGKVREFEQQITAHGGHVAPSILVQEPGSQKAFIVDGHHRALAARSSASQSSPTWATWTRRTCRRRGRRTPSRSTPATDPANA